jgi:GT2 family glycosyltransferase
MMIRKNILDEIGSYDERFFYSQDADLAFRIIKVSKIATIPEVLILWRSQKKSISAKKRWSQIKFEMLACIKAIGSNLYPRYYYLFFPMFFIKIFIPSFFKKFLRKTILKMI